MVKFVTNIFRYLRTRFNSFEKRFATYIFLVILIIVSVIVIYIAIAAKYTANQKKVRYTQDLLSQMDTLQFEHQDVVIQTRSYLLTGDHHFVQEAEHGIGRMKGVLLKLRASARQAGARKEQFDSLSGLFNAYLSVRQISVEDQKTKSFTHQDEVSLLYRNNNAFIAFSTYSSKIKRELQLLLRQQQLGFRESVQVASLAIRILLLFFVVSIIIAFVVVYKNMVRRNAAETALRNSETLLRSIIENSPMLVNVKDRQGKYILANRQFANLLSLAPEELIGKSNDDFGESDISQSLTAVEQHIIESNETSDIEVNLPTPDGVHTYITSKFPLLDQSGRLFGIGCTSTDITTIKRAHEALEKSYRMQQQIMNGLQKALSTSTDVLCVINAQGEFVLVSENSKCLWGYEPKEMMSKRSIDFVAEEDRKKTQLIAQQILAGCPVSDFTNHYRKKDGSLVPVLWSAKLLEEDKMIYCIARDATEKMKTATMLAQSQSRLEYAQRIARLGNWEWDIVHDLWSCSEEIFHLLGVNKSEGVDIKSMLFDLVHPDDKERLKEAKQQAIRTGKKLDIEHRIIRADQSICYVQTKGEVVFNADRQPVWFSGTMQDITERKNAELELQKLNEDLKRSAAELKSSNQDLERFAYVASHDLQEPLRMVSSFLTLIERKLNQHLDEVTKKYIHFAVDGAERMKILIQDLLKYSRISSSVENFEMINVNELVSECVKLYGNTVSQKGVQIDVQALPEVFGHKSQLRQLFQNLIGNAIKYTDKPDCLVEIGCCDHEREWQFFVKDNGIGIDPRFFEKIFVIFQRLHSSGQYDGTGIGLAICKRIVEGHGGKIWVESAPGQGSTFYFTIKKQPYA